VSDSSNPEFWLTDPLAIGSALNELLRNAEHLAVTRGVEPLPSVMVAVDNRRRTFRFRPYGGQLEFDKLKDAPELQFRGAAYGAQIDFPVVSGSRPITPEMDDSLDYPVFECDFPLRLYRLQRREYFRARVAPPNTRVAVWTSPAGGSIRLRIQDVSLSGVGLRSPLQADALPKPGDELRDMVLDFNELGTLRADLRVIATRTVTEFDMRQGNMELINLGCEFQNEDSRRETFLQRLVYQLEQAARAA
jgi:c-di-GMP-binding flagellar brake protein YcgR